MEIYISDAEGFNLFLKDFIPQMKEKMHLATQASWDLETTGSKEAADRYAALAHEVNLLFSNKDNYAALLEFKKSGGASDPDSARTLDLLIQMHKVNQLPEDLLKKVTQKEAELSASYVQFRASFEGQSKTENELLELLKTEKNVKRRKAVWEATKQIGEKQAPLILELVKLRNQMAHELGYADFYQMQHDIQETDPKWLIQFLDQFNRDSEAIYEDLIQDIDRQLAEQYKVTPSELGAWAWTDPFCQEDPIKSSNLDPLLKDINLVKAGRLFFNSMGFEVDDILERSDLYERENKNQHAFCTHIDRFGDIRILTNLKPSLRWLDTIIHELGHAVYEKGYAKELPWILRTPPHMIPTEAMALVTGRHAFDAAFLKALITKDNLDPLLEEARQSSRRRQLIFSRWVLVMVHFESSLYANPDQDLNALWWSLVKKYQKVNPPSDRAGKSDWACKYHIGLAPVYYHSYLLGEFLASMITKHFEEKNGTASLFDHKNVSVFLNQKLFAPGNRMKWDDLIQSAMGESLKFEPWIEEFKK